MYELDYTPDPNLKVHPEGVIRLLCSEFQSHEAGLPEWVKNASDAYARLDVPEDDRNIVLIFDHNRRSTPPSISCLDFCGMSVRDLEEDFRHWGSPDAARGGAGDANVQGGHGNGGKCYMLQMFQDYALVQTVRDGKGSRYGVPAGTQRFGYVPDPEDARGYPVGNVAEELKRSLKPVNCSLESLPPSVKEQVGRITGFTIVTGFGPTGYEHRIDLGQLLQNLQDHPQMIRSLELCSIFVVVNGKPYESGSTLQLRTIPPLEGTDEPLSVPVPGTLVDPVSGQKVETCEDGDATGVLELRTSKVSMRWKKKYRHNVLYRAGAAGVVGYVPVVELDVSSPYRDHIYGEVRLRSLASLAQNARRGLADSPLSRALNDWLSKEIQRYAKEFEARERKKYAHEERDAVSKMNEALDRWKNRFLVQLTAGHWGEGGGGGTNPDRPRLPSGKVARMELTLTHRLAGVGVALRPVLRFYDDTGQQVRSTPFKWISDDANVAWVDEDVGVINTFAPGSTTIWAETLDGRVTSNAEDLQVVGIQRIQLSPAEVELAVGSRSRVEAECTLAGGKSAEGVYLVWTEGDSAVARVSASGMVYGFGVGATEVTAGDDRALAPPVRVVVAESDGKGPGSGSGRGYPLVLVSGAFDQDPETDEEVNFSSDAPPVAQRPQDVSRNIWWINSAAPLADLYLNKAAGYGFETREWRMYHLERMIEVILQIALMYDAENPDQLLSLDEWIVEWGNKAAEIQAAAVADLTTFIATGELPAN